MNERYNPRWVRNENRHAVGDADRESSSLLGSDVPVRLGAENSSCHVTRYF